MNFNRNNKIDLFSTFKELTYSKFKEQKNRH